MKERKMTSSSGQAQAIVKLCRNDPSYPKSLVKVLNGKAPENLYCLGNLSLLDKVGVGFCGSRKSSLKGIETAIDCASQVAKIGLNVISGNAAGVDFAAHHAALENGGTTILVLPEGINHFRVKKSFEAVWDWNRVLVVSQFEPDAAWKAFRAMERNRIIIALSQAMIVIEAGETGGTLDAGMASLKLKQPLYVAVYENMTEQAPGNDRLIQLGGHKLTKQRSLGKANLKPLFENAVKKESGTALEREVQLSFL
jgi:DNA processing protein